MTVLSYRYPALGAFDARFFVDICAMTRCSHDVDAASKGGYCLAGFSPKITCCEYLCKGIPICVKESM